MPEVTPLQVTALEPSAASSEPVPSLLCLHVHVPSVLSPPGGSSREKRLPKDQAGPPLVFSSRPISTSCLESCLCASCGPGGLSGGLSSPGDRRLSPRQDPGHQRVCVSRLCFCGAACRPAGTPCARAGLTWSAELCPWCRWILLGPGPLRGRGGLPKLTWTSPRTVLGPEKAWLPPRLGRCPCPAGRVQLAPPRPRPGRADSTVGAPGHVGAWRVALRASRPHRKRPSPHPTAPRPRAPGLTVGRQGPALGVLGALGSAGGPARPRACPKLKPLFSLVLRNPFAHVQLKPTVTNDRSAPLLS